MKGIFERDWMKLVVGKWPVMNEINYPLNPTTPHGRSAVLRKSNGKIHR